MMNSTQIKLKSTFILQSLLFLFVTFNLFSIVGCGGGKKNGTPPATGNAILPDAPQLAPPKITYPPQTLHYSNKSTLTIEGICTVDPGSKVYLGGDENKVTNCTEAGTFSFEVSKSNDGVYNYTLRNESLTLHPSENSTMTWTKSTVAPPAPTITSSTPSAGLSSFTLNGSCGSGNNVVLNSSSSPSSPDQTTPCSANGTYSFNISESADGSFDYEVTQTDIFGNESIASSMSWIRNTTPPTTPVILVPNSSPLSSSDLSLILSGTCQPNTTTNLSGSTTDTLDCDASGTFSFEITPSSPGTFNYTITSLGSNGINSLPAQFQWTQNLAVPSTPSITSPNASPINNNASTLTVTGTCDGTNTVHLSGADTANTTCASGTFSFAINHSTDGSYNYSIHQTNAFSQSSGTVGLIWVRDATPPMAPIIISPVLSPYTNKETQLSISGTCENDAKVYLTGANSDLVTCSGSSFTFTVSKSTSGTYNYSVHQIDGAGNISATDTQQWILDLTSPLAPTLVSPATNPLVSNVSTITVSGGCENSATVNISGSYTSTQTCSSSSYSFSVTKSTDGSYNFSISQTDPAGNSSPSLALQWTRDTVAPSAPVVTLPSQNPLTSASSVLNLSGTCESQATLNLSGSGTGSTTCASSSFSLSSSKSTDSTYNYSITQTDLAGNVSPAATFTWIRNTTTPAAPTISSPASTNFTSNSTTLNITGGCLNQATVNLSGDSTQSTTCSSSAYNFTVNKSSDGTYNFSITQTNLSGLTSSAATLAWIKNTTVPLSPTITSPANPYTSADSNLTITLGCTTGYTILYSGDLTGSQTCSAGSASASISKSSDGVYTIQFTQRDLANNVSAPTTFQWTRLTATPSTPTITSPSSSPKYSNGNSLTIAGGCTSGNTVSLSGADSLSTTCSANSYTFSPSKITDGTYTFLVKQTNASNINSLTANQVWIRDSVSPSNLVLTAPTSLNFTSNQTNLTVAGNCEVGATVKYSGSATGSLPCGAGGTFSTSLSQSTSGVYTYNFSQTDPALNNSGNVILTWNLDLMAPIAPVIHQPATNPFVSANNSLTLQGTCEAGATVSLTGISSTPVLCTPTSTFSMTVSAGTSTGFFDLFVLQTDAAGNSSPTTEFAWEIDTSIPATPTFVITTGSSSYSGNFSSNTSSINLAVNCDSANQTLVELSGDVISTEVNGGTLELTCTTSPVTFVINKSTDGIFNFQITQTDISPSAAASFEWTRDTQSPSPLIITNPTSNPFTGPSFVSISGTCESNATVYLSGDAVQSTTCAASMFNFLINKDTDNTYQFSFMQKDLAGNSSTAITFQWIRNSNSLPLPVITSPTSSPYLSNLTQLTLSGTCEAGYLVSLGGAGAIANDIEDPLHSLTQTCSNEGTFSYTINKSVSGSYAFTLNQTMNSVTSSDVAFTWNLDITPPVTSITTTSTDPNLSTSISFTVTANETSTTYCKLDNNSYTLCPATYTSLTNGSHTLYAYSTDTAGNTGSVVTYNWTQLAYNTVALYHLNPTHTPIPAPTKDYGLFTESGSFNNNLTTVGSFTTTNGVYKLNSSLTSYKFGTGTYFYTNNNGTFNTVSNKLTIEGFVRLSALPSSNSYYTLVSNTGTTSGSYGWKVKLAKTSSKYYLQFEGTKSLTTAPTTYRSSSLSLSTNTWYYFAVTYNAGSIGFYFSNSSTATSRGTASMGTNVSLATPNTPFRIGADSTAGTGASLWMNGYIDEVRVSNIVRTPTVPTIEFNAD